MNKLREKWYLGDSRYEKVLEQMQLLGIQDVTTMRQHKNGTITWKLPIKNKWNNGSFIEVGSFASGMVRNNNSCYSNYQLNKCKPYTEYFKDYKWNEECTKQTFTGKYRKYTGKQRVLIPIEIDRLEYLIAYCLKNYYIKHANFVAGGEYVPKWKLEHAVSSNYDCGHYDKISELEHKLYNYEQRGDSYKEGYEHKKQYIKDLENKISTREDMNNDLECANNRLLDKLQSIIRTARH